MALVGDEGGSQWLNLFLLPSYGTHMMLLPLPIFILLDMSSMLSLRVLILARFLSSAQVKWILLRQYDSCPAPIIESSAFAKRGSKETEYACQGYGFGLGDDAMTRSSSRSKTPLRKCPPFFYQDCLSVA